MAMKVEKVDVWTGEIRDEVGGLSAALEPLVAAGADFSFLVARRHRPGTGVVFLGGVRGAKQMQAARSVGLAKAENATAIRLEAPDKPGLVHNLVTRLASAGINLFGVSASVIGSKCVLVLGFDSAADRDKAARLLRK
jgi:hypothetical protein